MPRPRDRLLSIWPAILLTFSAKVFAAGIDFLTLVITAQLLGPLGRGMVAVVFTWSRLLMAFFGLSLHQVVVNRLTEKGRAHLSKILLPLMTLAIVVCVAAWLAGGLIYVLSGSGGLKSVPPSLLLLGLPLLPLMLSDTYSSHIFSAIDRLRYYNTSLLTGRSLALAISVLGIVFLGLGAHAPILGTLVGLSVVFLGLLMGLKGHLPDSFEVDFQEIRALLTGGLKLHLNTIGAFLLTQMDVIMLSQMRSLEEVGWYQAAAELIAAPLLLTTTVSLVLYSRLVAVGPDQGWGTQRRVIWQSLLWLLVFAIAAYFAAPSVIPLVLGQPFGPTVTPFRILLPALAGMGFAQLMGTQWIVRGLFLQASALTLGVGLLNVILNVIFIPRFGMYAAAWTTVGAFGISVLTNGALAIYVELRWRMLRRRASVDPAGGFRKNS